MDGFDLAEAAERSGLNVEELSRLVALGIVSPDADDRFSPAVLRRAGLVKGLTDAGIPLDGLRAALRSGQVSLDFLDGPAYERFSALSGDTFADVAERTGVPIQLLLFIREATGSTPALPDDRIRDAELPFVGMIEGQVKAGFDPLVIQQQVRSQGETLGRLAETEAGVWRTEVIGPATAAGKRPDEIFGSEFDDTMSALTEKAVIAMYHLQQARTWTANIIEGVETMLAAAGLHSRLEHPPAMCFLDITGYTQLTQVQGDAAAARLAEQLGLVVQRTSVKHGGRAVKWLGDGVMLYFPNPGRGVVAALEMVADVAAAGLAPAHVGLHAGPVIFQQGDYYGQTVNVASRIADYAQAGQVIVSQAVVDASAGAEVEFRDVGPVDLKGVTGAMRLHAAFRPA